MNYLLDTCTFLWLTSDRTKLSAVATRTLNSENNRFYLSLASVWEIFLKVKTGKLTPKLKPQANDWLNEALGVWRTPLLPIEVEELWASTILPEFHKDPFDRLLVAQAQVQKFTLLTPDPLIRQYPIATLW